MEKDEKNLKLPELACYWLSCLLDFGITGLERFVELCGGLEFVFQVSDKAIRAMEGLSPKLKELPV